MKKLLHSFGILTLLLMATACYTEVIIEDDIIYEAPINARATVESYELWYVDINRTQGSGSIPFLEVAFTLSFRGGTLMANNNLAGIGKTGNGFGIDVGDYNGFPGSILVNHDLDGNWEFEVILLGGNSIELFNPETGTSFFLEGYDRNTFDYDGIFYDNIHYFLQEYESWEKVFVSETGAINEFDQENHLRFFSSGSEDIFQSSQDGIGTPIQALQWDYEGLYTVYDVNGDPSLKTLTLDYDFLGNDYFELYVIDDRTVELFHPDSGTVYEFAGRGYQQYLKASDQTPRKRIKRTLPVMNVKRQRK